MPSRLPAATHTSLADAPRRAAAQAIRPTDHGEDSMGAGQDEELAAPRQGSGEQGGGVSEGTGRCCLQQEEACAAHGQHGAHASSPPLPSPPARLLALQSSTSWTGGGSPTAGGASPCCASCSRGPCCSCPSPSPSWCARLWSGACQVLPAAANDSHTLTDVALVPHPSSPCADPVQRLAALGGGAQERRPLLPGLLHPGGLRVGGAECRSLSCRLCW